MTRAGILLERLEEGIVKKGLAAGAVGAAAYLGYKYGGDLLHHKIPSEHTPEGHQKYQDALNRLHGHASGKEYTGRDTLERGAKQLSDISKEKNWQTHPDIEKAANLVSKGAKEVKTQRHVLQTLPHREFGHYGI